MEQLHYFYKDMSDDIYLISADEWTEKTSSVNCWLIKGSEKALLIDCGNPCSGLKEYVESLCKGLDLVLALSHGHFDHTGALHEFDDFWMSEEDEILLKGGNGLPATKYHGNLHPLKEGDQIDLGERVIDVYGIQGHTKGSLVFLDSKSKTLFSGDSVGRRGLFTMGDRLSISRYFDDLLKIEKLDFYQIASAHDRYYLDKDVIRHYVTVLIERIGFPDGNWKMGEEQFCTIHFGNDVEDKDYLSISFREKDHKKMTCDIDIWKKENQFWLNGRECEAIPHRKLEKSSTLEEISSMPGFSSFARSLFVCRDETWNGVKTVPCEHFDHNGRILMGLKRLQDLMESGNRVFYRYYGEEETKDDRNKENTGLFFFPGKKDAPFVVVIPGGGYKSVCTFLEGFPIAAELNSQGYNAFVLVYRVREKGILPKPIDDFVKALTFILENKGLFRVDGRYGVIGFSAGGHLAAETGTVNHGMRNYGLPNPEVIGLCYAAIDLRTAENNASEDLDYLLGNRKEIDSYCINLNMDEKYPPTVLWQAMDDDTVDYSNSLIMANRLGELKIPFKMMSYPKGGHGLINPHDKYADLWPEETLGFMDYYLGDLYNR